MAAKRELLLWDELTENERVEALAEQARACGGVPPPADLTLMLYTRLPAVPDLRLPARLFAVHTLDRATLARMKYDRS